MPAQASTANDSVSLTGQAAFQDLLASLASQAAPEVAAQLRTFSVSSARISELQSELYRKHLALWQSMLVRETAGGSELAPERADRRFTGGEWKASPVFDYIRRAYLINSRFLTEMVETLDLEPRAKGRLRFVTRQFIDAMSPANFAATNPEAVKLALDTQGESMSRGIRNLIEDVGKGRISTNDESAFELGRNMAVSKGSVIFQNELIQLIQYSPLTERVHVRPLVMVPPCINKFYVLDLQPENSLVRYAVEQGHTVFMVSWRNITPDLGHFTWDDYIRLGVLEAIEAALDIAKTRDLNLLGFCVGGTMVGAAAAVMAARGEDRLASVTQLASMLDFSDTGEIGLFVDEASVAAREKAIGGGGVMPGRELAFVFSALRANDLVWSYVVNNYLKGNTPEAFDLLYWNADSTNLPGPMYCYYVRNMYLANSLSNPGRLTMLGAPVDLGRVRAPAYIIATREDHIVPWKTAYRSVHLLGGEKRFVLGAAGHIAGAINPVSKNRRSHWVRDELAADAESWLAGATERPGSWWSDWAAWLERRGGGQTKARKRLGNARRRPIEPAPGRYVKQRVI